MRCNHNHCARSAMPSRLGSWIPRPPRASGCCTLAHATTHPPPPPHMTSVPVQRKALSILFRALMNHGGMSRMRQVRIGIADRMDLIRARRPLFFIRLPFHTGYLSATRSTRGWSTYLESLCMDPQVSDRKVNHLTGESGGCQLQMSLITSNWSKLAL
jgi:hypothetical protein